MMNLEQSASEKPIDLAALLDKHLQAADLAIISLQNLPESFMTARLLADIGMIRKELSQVGWFIHHTYRKVLIDPGDDDYLILHAIDQRLEYALRTAKPDNTNLDQIDLLVSTIEKGLHIVRHLTSP
jgi:hypothetical protein